MEEGVLKQFSRSPLWDLQRQYFEEQGIKAWQQGEVPHYITSNPTVAKAYAEVVFGFLRDRARMRPANKETIYLLELGAGSGRFAFHFLKYLSLLCGQAAFEAPSWCYVLSDFTESNIKYWQQHTCLKPFVESGQLDFCLFDAEKDAALHLVHSGKHIGANSLSDPLVIIANYFFDGITQDLFHVHENKLHEVGVTMSFEEGLPADAGPAEKLQKLDMKYHTRKVNVSYYEEKGFNEILDLYRSSLRQSWVLFPHTGLRCLERLRALSHEGFLLLSCDKGNHLIEDIEKHVPPFLAKHGSFSLSVNYHAIKMFYGQQGATALFTQHHHSSINVGAIFMLNDSADYKETMLAQHHFIERFGPDDFYLVKTHSFLSLIVMPLKVVLAYLRLCSYDADAFKQCIPRLLTLISEATSPSEKKDMLLMIRQVWDGYYLIGEKQDLAFDTGMLLYKMDMYHEALEFFERSLKDYDAIAPVYYNMAACYFQLGDDVQARSCIDRTLELEPAHEGAMEILKQLDKQQEPGQLQQVDELIV